MSAPLIIDSFAGGGGASTGIEMALGRSPDFAINHSAEALALHEANHPDTAHLQTSIYAIDPREIVAKGRRVGLAWFSPDCKHFSKAKGGAPLNKNIRDLAWVVVHWAELVRPDVIALENVEEFQTWAPLRQRQIDGAPVFNKDGTPYMEPDPDRKGETFRTWVRRLRRMGYKVEWRQLRACDFGAATIRKRLFLIARCDGRPIVWPEPTHGDPDSDAVKSGQLQPWRTAAECIDWSLPCPSIFDSSDEIKNKHGLRAIRPLAPATLARIARGMKRHAIDADRPFIVNLTHGPRTEDTASPLHTITCANRGEKAIVTPSLISLKGNDRRDSSMETPHPTILAGGGHSAIAAPLLTYAQHGGQNRSADAPAHTFTASLKDQNAVIAPTLIQSGYGEREGQAPRSLDPLAPLGTIVAGGIKHAPAIATLVGCGGRSGQSRPRAVNEPKATITAKADTCVAAAFFAQHNGMRQGVNPGWAADAPISTLTATGSHQGAVAAWFAKYYGTGDGAAMDEPCHTITTKDRMGHMQAELAVPEFSPEHEARARQVADFLRSHDAWDGGDFVTLEIDRQSFVVVDIGMRMLTPRELFTAQGFPTDYVIEGTWQERGGEWTWIPFTKSTQVSCCGNSVSPHPAAALIRANCHHLAQKMETAA